MLLLGILLRFQPIQTELFLWCIPDPQNSRYFFLSFQIDVSWKNDGWRRSGSHDRQARLGHDSVGGLTKTQRLGEHLPNKWFLSDIGNKRVGVGWEGCPIFCHFFTNFVFGLFIHKCKCFELKKKLYMLPKLGGGGGERRFGPKCTKKAFFQVVTTSKTTKWRITCALESW